MTFQHSNNTALPDLIDRILDKGLVINADIRIDLAGTEILGIKLRAALASFETAAKYGLAFPSGTNLRAPAWQALGIESDHCPDCGNLVFTKEETACSCGWKGRVVRQGNKEIAVVRNESDNNTGKTVTHR